MLLVTIIVTSFSIYPHWATPLWDHWVYVKMDGASNHKKEADTEAPKKPCILSFGQQGASDLVAKRQ